MAALTGERDTPKKHRHYIFDYLFKGNSKAFSGGGLCADATGYAIKAADTAGIKTIGRANQTVDSTAAGPKGLLADGATSIEAEHGVFRFKTTGGNAITQADVGITIAEWLDDQTVVRAAGTTNHVKAGKVVGFDSATGEVWIDTLIQS